METATIQAEPREKQSRRRLANLRKRGMIPAVIYGHEKPPETVALSAHDLELALDHVQHVIKLKIDGRQRRQQFLIKDVQYDVFEKHVIHADLMRIDPDERIRVNVPVELRGEPKGVKEGGVLVHLMPEIEIECRPADIPELLRPRVDDLDVNDALHVRDIEFPEGVTLISDAEDVIAVVQPKREAPEVEEEAVEAAEEAAAAEPEVIGRGKQEAEESDESEG
jgi:large subunit ribosomal protein L25